MPGNNEWSAGALGYADRMLRLDSLLTSADNALRTLAGAVHAARTNPADVRAASAAPPDAPLSDAERRLSAALLRVDHVGEVCAQALYQAQALAARDPALRAQMSAAAREETDHLAWTQERLAELGVRTSLLNPLWYAGAFGVGLVAGRFGDRVSRGFVVETERQVEEHLTNHLERLPAGDERSRAIVAQMREDERRHGDSAASDGAARLPLPVRLAMRAAAKVMTVTAHRL